MRSALGTAILGRQILSTDYDGLYWDTEQREYKYKYRSKEGNMIWSEWVRIPKHKFIKKHGAIFDHKERTPRNV